MDIQMIKEFLVLADHLNYQEAAEELYISLSSLSKHITKMEKELTFLLFDRSTHKVQLSPYGKIFYSYAKEIIHSYDNCLEALKSYNSKLRKQITICYMPLLSQYGLIESIASFHRTNPQIEMHIFEDSNPINVLNAKKCDVAFSAEYESSKTDFRRYLCNIDCLAAVVPNGHRFAEKESINIEDLRGEHLILCRKSVPLLGPYLSKLCHEAGFEPEISSYVSYDSTVVKFVTEGLGISVMNMNHIPSTRKNEICILPLYPSINLNIYMYCANNPDNADEMEKFIDYYKDRFICT